MSRKTLTVEVMSSGNVKTQVDPRLISGLSELLCPEGEECSIHMKASESSSAVVAFLLRQKEVLADSHWMLDRPKSSEFPHIYARLFENQSSEEIIEAVKRVLEMPGIHSD